MHIMHLHMGIFLPLFQIAADEQGTLKLLQRLHSTLYMCYTAQNLVQNLRLAIKITWGAFIGLNATPATVFSLFKRIPRGKGELNFFQNQLWHLGHQKHNSQSKRLPFVSDTSFFLCIDCSS